MPAKQTPVNLAEPRVPDYFRDRDNEVNNVLATIAKNSWVCLVGMGGVGKTTTAARIATLIKQSQRDSVLWLDIGPNAELGTLIETFARSIGSSVKSLSNPKQQASHLRSMTAGKRLFIVFDDVSSDEVLSQLLDCVGPSNSVLITARDQKLPSLFRFGVRIVLIDSLPPEYATSLLLDLANQGPTNESQAQGWRALATAVGNLPLAIEVIAGQLRFRPAVNPESYLHTYISTGKWLTSEPTLMKLKEVITSSVNQMRPEFANAFACLVFLLVTDSHVMP